MEDCNSLNPLVKFWMTRPNFSCVNFMLPRVPWFLCSIKDNDNTRTENLRYFLATNDSR
jgi:hypothetical protein